MSGGPPPGAPGAPLLESADRALDWVRARIGPGRDAEIFLARGRDRGLETRDGSIETLHETADEGMGLRVVEGGRMGFASAAGLDPERLEGVFREVLAQLRHLPPDERRALPRAAPASDAGLAASMNDPSLFEHPLRDQIPRLAACGEAALRTDPRARRVLRAGYSEYTGEVAIASTRGVRAMESGTHCSFGISVVAEKNGCVQVGSGGCSARFYADLDFERAARDAAWRAGALVSARKLPGGRRAALLDPWVAGEFLDLVAEALSAEAVQRGKSLFRGRMGARVASPLVTFVDDPRRPRGIATAAFDDEGVPTRRKVMIEGGVLRDYFYDAYTAAKDGRESNGSAGRGSYRGAPGPSSSNFFVQPGTVSRESLVKSTPEGILVLEVLGLHMADPVTGEFSVGVSGIAVEGGELTHGVRGAMLSGSVSELLERVDAAADDLTFYGRLAAPTLRAADMMIA